MCIIWVITTELFLEHPARDFNY